MGDRDEFDRIVEHLDLDLSFPDDQAADTHASRDREAERDETPESSASREPDDDDADDAFYRRLDPRPPTPWRPTVVAAWAGVIGAPLALVVSTVAAYILPRPLLAALAMVFVAGSIYLISQLPEHGPSRDDGPDDGAVL